MFDQGQQLWVELVYCVEQVLVSGFMQYEVEFNVFWIEVQVVLCGGDIGGEDDDLGYRQYLQVNFVVGDC